MRDESRFRIGHLAIDRLTFAEALETIEAMVRSGRGGTVFTPNVDHVVSAEDSEQFRQAYDSADLSLVDGMPLIWVSKILGPALPEKISGSDLVPRLLEVAARNAWRVFFFGGADGSAVKAAESVKLAHPSIEIAGTAAPFVSLDDPEETRAEMAKSIAATKPHLVLVGLGSPKQELWIAKVSELLAPSVVLAVGASIDFLAGAVPRAPSWMSEHGLEWLYRLTREPMRLAPRYLGRDPKFLAVLAREILMRARGRRLALGAPS